MTHRLAMFLLFLCFPLATLAQGADESEVEQNALHWIANCSNEADRSVMRCTVSHALTVAETGQRIIAVTVEPNAANPTLSFILPQGLNLQRGVGMRVDDSEEVRFAFTASDANGIYSVVPFTEAYSTAFKAGRVLKINVTGRQGRVINFDLPLSGFSNALDLVN